MPATLDTILEARLVAILRLDDLTHAVELSSALLDAGVVALEFTLTNRSALSALQAVARKLAAFREGTATIGIGSVRTNAQAIAAADAGAQFLVTPTLSPKVIQTGVNAGIPVISGAFSPTEIASAWDAGAAVVKVFPARGLGPDYIRDLLAPMPELKLMPTGGVNLGNMTSYFEAGAAAVGVGGNLLDSAALQAGDWAAITSSAAQFVQAAARRSDAE